MARVCRNMYIRAPVDDIFSYMSDPSNQPEWLPSAIEVHDIRGEGVGQCYGWTYKMSGITFKGQAYVTGYIPNQQLAYITTGGISSSWSWTYTPESGLTKVAVSIDYVVPVPALGTAGEKILMRQNEKEADLAIKKLKEIMETAKVSDGAGEMKKLGPRVRVKKSQFSRS